MVVTLNIMNYDVCHLLIDNEILTDILFYDAFSNSIKILISSHKKIIAKK